MEKILFINMDALLPALFWGNIVSFFFLLIYHNKNKFTKDKRTSLYLIIARICHAFHYFTAFGRYILPDWLSVNLGIVMLFVGFYFEAQGILRIIRKNSKHNDIFLGSVLSVFTVFLNVMEIIAPSGGIRITIASLGVICLMVLPVIRMLVSNDASVYIKTTAIFYIAFLFLLMLRAIYGLYNQDVNILTTNILQSVTFLSLTLQLIIALPSYALIIKDYTDEALLKMATTDRLTGAINRHAFMGEAEEVFNNCRRFRSPFSILFLDIDYFKDINDKYGHTFGDTVLARTASVIDNCLRKNDLSCRYGGEEFVIMLSGTDGISAGDIAQRIMNGIRNTRFEEHPDFTFAVSIGIYNGIPSHEDTLDGAVSAADKAMYEAKRAGRNRVVFFESV